jgi:P4 family phage/plasmid primase-like protien
MNNNILLLKNFQDRKGSLISIENIYKIITNPKASAWFAETRGFYDSYVEALRNQREEEAKILKNQYVNRKQKLAMAFYGLSPKNLSRDSVEISGFLYMDFDSKDNEEYSANEIKEFLKDHFENLTLCYKSVSGAGVSAIFHFGELLSKENYSKVYNLIAFEVLQKFGLVADAQCNNFNRGAFLSNDLEAYFNPNPQLPDSDIITKAYILSDGKESQDKEYYIDSKNDFEKDIYNTLSYCKKNNKLLVRDYDEWYKVIAVIVNEFHNDPQKCYKIANDVSELYKEKYSEEDTNKKVSYLLKKKLTQISKRTFYYYAKEAGYRIYKERKGDITYPEFKNLFLGTEVQIVRYVIEKEFNNNILFNLTTKEYMLYSDGVWKSNPSFQMNQKFDEWVVKTRNCVLNEVLTDESSLSDSEKEERGAEFKKKFELIDKFFQRYRTVTGNKNICSLFEKVNDIIKSNQDFDQHNHIICLKNGVYDLEKFTFRTHNKNLFLTKSLNFCYDNSQKCPKFLKFLQDIFLHNKEYIEFFQKFLGLCLTGRTDLFQGIVFCYGTGRNGKSLFLNILKEFLSEYSQHASSDLIIERKNYTFNDDYEKAMLFGKRLISFSEIPANSKLKESVIKDLTGGDEIKCRQIREKAFSFKPTFKIIIAGNHKPSVDGTDEGIWRRIYLVNFSRVFSEKESRPAADIMREIREEFPGIFNWAVEGYKLLLKEGILNMTQLMKSDLLEYRSNQSILIDFLQEYFAPAEGEKVLRDDVYKLYSQYASENLSLRETLSLQRFSKIINKTCFQGVQLAIKRFGRDQVKYIYNLKKLEN